MQREITPIFGSGKEILCETNRAITPYGGLAVFVDYLEKIRYREAIRRYMPVQLTSRNAIAPEETYTALLSALGDYSPIALFFTATATPLCRTADSLSGITA